MFEWIIKKVGKLLWFNSLLGLLFTISYDRIVDRAFDLGFWQKGALVYFVVCLIAGIIADKYLSDL